MNNFRSFKVCFLRTGYVCNTMVNTAFFTLTYIHGGIQRLTGLPVEIQDGIRYHCDL
jgi:hypothetical protein